MPSSMPARTRFRSSEFASGMQCATIEYARDVVGLAGADSTEFDPQTPHRVIYKLRELLGVDEMGGTMRLGAWPCKIEKDSTAFKAYGTTDISERHRHRYEFNCEYEKSFDRCRIPHHRPLARRQVRGNRRGPGPSVVSRPASSIRNSSPRLSRRTRFSPPSSARAQRASAARRTLRQSGKTSAISMSAKPSQAALAVDLILRLLPLQIFAVPHRL